MNIIFTASYSLQPRDKAITKIKGAQILQREFQLQSQHQFQVIWGEISLGKEHGTPGGRGLARTEHCSLRGASARSCPEWSSPTTTAELVALQASQRVLPKFAKHISIGDVNPNILFLCCLLHPAVI